MSEPLFDVSRFDIEQEIMQIGNFVEILKNYADMVYDGQWTSSSQDNIHTTLHGFAHLLDAHADKMMLSHNKHYRLNEWKENPDYGQTQTNSMVEGKTSPTA
jgi:hypothetical protein